MHAGFHFLSFSFSPHLGKVRGSFPYGKRGGVGKFEDDLLGQDLQIFKGHLLGNEE